MSLVGMTTVTSDALYLGVFDMGVGRYLEWPRTVKATRMYRKRKTKMKAKVVNLGPAQPLLGRLEEYDSV
jgi:hypothetical protein